MRPRPDYPALEYVAAAVLLLEAPALVRCESLQQLMPQLQEGAQTLDVAVVWELALALWRTHEASRYEDVSPEAPPARSPAAQRLGHQDRPSLLRKLFQRRSRKASRGEARDVSPTAASATEAVEPAAQPVAAMASQPVAVTASQPVAVTASQPVTVTASQPVTVTASQPTLAREPQEGSTAESQQMGANGVHKDVESIFTKYFNFFLCCITLASDLTCAFANSMQISVGQRMDALAKGNIEGIQHKREYAINTQRPP